MKKIERLSAAEKQIVNSLQKWEKDVCFSIWDGTPLDVHFIRNSGLFKSNFPICFNYSDKPMD